MLVANIWTQLQKEKKLRLFPFSQGLWAVSWRNGLRRRDDEASACLSVEAPELPPGSSEGQAYGA